MIIAWLISIDNPNGIAELTQTDRYIVSQSCGTTLLIGQTTKDGSNRYLQIKSSDITQMIIGGIRSALWSSCCKMTEISSCLDIVHMESILNGKATHGEKGRTSFSGFKRMEVFLLETQRLMRSTSQLGLVTLVMHPTVLRCLKRAGSRSWINMVKLSGLLIRPKLSAWKAIDIRGTITQEQG